MTLASELSPRQADETLAELGGLRRRTRRAVGTLWFPLVLFGSLTLLEIPFELAVGPPVIAFFWLVAGPVGCLLVGRHLRREGRLRGMTGHPPRAAFSARVSAPAASSSGWSAVGRAGSGGRWRRPWSG